MESNYFIQINEKERTIMLQPCNAIDAIKLFSFYKGDFSLLKETQQVISIDFYKIGEGEPKRVLI